MDEREIQEVNHYTVHKHRTSDISYDPRKSWMSHDIKEPSEKQELTMKQKTLGLVAFVMAVTHYSFQALSIKMVIQRFSVSAPELIYYQSIFGLVAFYFNSAYRY